MKNNDLIRISANELGCTLSRSKGGITLYSIRDRKTKKNFLTQQRPLFTLTARALSSDETITVSSEKGWKNCVSESAGNDTVVILSGNTELPGVTVILCAHTVENRIEWTTNLISENDEYSLYSCDYPILSCDAKKDCYYLSPNGPGELWNSLTTCRSCQDYPSYGASMQFMAYYNKATKRGIYYGLHDPAPAFKRIFFEKNAHEKVFTCCSKLPLVDINKPRNSQTLAGTCVWEIYDGDWYEAALLYRDFFLNQASWKPAMGEKGRLDTPAWMKEVDHWWIVRMGQDDSYVDKVLEANADLEYPSAIHLYDWFRMNFDNDYPHYFPTKDAFPASVKRLHEKGVKVMPYINGRLWDTHDRDLEDWQWTAVAKPFATKDRNGNAFTESYSSKESDGSSVVLGIMCPSTALWQEKMKEIVGRLLNEVGVDAVYMDQIAAAKPQLCEDPNHSHRAGGGSWWMDSYNNLLDHVQRERPENAAISTECTADPFIKNMPSYLTWLWLHNNQVPAYVAVYAGYITMFGRNYRCLSWDDHEGQRILLAQSFTFGEQIGWNDPDLYLQMKHKDFYKKCVHERKKMGEYFNYGRLLRSPEFTDDQPMIRTERCKEAYGGLLEHSACFVEHWEDLKGNRVVVMANAAECEAEITFASGLADGKYALSGDANGVLEIKDGVGKCKLPALSIAYATAL